VRSGSGIDVADDEEAFDLEMFWNEDEEVWDIRRYVTATGYLSV